VIDDSALADEIAATHAVELHDDPTPTEFAQASTTVNQPQAAERLDHSSGPPQNDARLRIVVRDAYAGEHGVGRTR
jgi:hypothetical protein